ncbi:MAG: GntR family transcriptional regulator [Gemmatimonadaceae bacterium]
MTNSTRSQEIADRLRRRLLSGLTLGVLKDGDRLPGVRAAATEFGVDPRVVLAAYDELEVNGVVERRDRSGVYIRATCHETAITRSDWMVDIAMASLQHGIRPAVLGLQLSRVFQSRKLHALVVDCNDDQIWSLSDELTLDYGLNVTTADLDLLALGNSLPEMPTHPSVVVTTSFHVREASEIAEELGVPMIAVTMCTDLFAEVNSLMMTRDVFFIVSDSRMARKLERIFEESENSHRFNVMVEGSEAVDEIPDLAPVYMTRLTRTRMPGSPLLRRCLPEARVFSQESARELISLMIQVQMDEPNAGAQPITRVALRARPDRKIATRSA